MDNYDENDLIEIEKEVEELRNSALKKVQTIHPEIEYVIDRRTVDDYTYRTWDYPGKWYAVFTIPKGFGGKEEVIDDIVNETIRYFTERKTRKDPKRKNAYSVF